VGGGGGGGGGGGPRAGPRGGPRGGHPRGGGGGRGRPGRGRGRARARGKRRPSGRGKGATRRIGPVGRRCRRRGSSRPPGPTENTVGRPGAHLELPLHGGTRSLEDLLHSTGNLRADSVTCGREGHRRGGALGPGGHLRPPRFLRAHAMGPSLWPHYRSRGRSCHNIRAAPPILLTGAIAAASSRRSQGGWGAADADARGAIPGIRYQEQDEIQAKTMHVGQE